MVKTQPPELKKFMDKKLSGKLLTTMEDDVERFVDRRTKLPSKKKEHLFQKYLGNEVTGKCRLWEP